MIINMLAEGKTVKEISVFTGTNVRTLEAYIQRMRKESNCVNVTHLVVKSLKLQSS